MAENSIEILLKNFHFYVKLNCEAHLLDEDLLVKCFDLLTQLYVKLPEQMQAYSQKLLIAEIALKFFTEINNTHINSSVINLLAFVAKADKIILQQQNIELILTKIVQFLDSPLDKLINKGNYADENLNAETDLFISCCATVPALLLCFPENFLKDFIENIMRKLLRILCFQRVTFILSLSYIIFL